MLTLARTLPVTFGATTKELPVVRLIATQKLRQLDLSRLTEPMSLVASEKVEITFRAKVADFYDELVSGTMAGPLPHGSVQFAEQSVDAMIARTEAAAPSFADEPGVLLTVLLLRVPVDAIDIDADWEKDEEHSPFYDGAYVIAVKPKARLHDAG